jgi:hypothetical protein
MGAGCRHHFRRPPGFHVDVAVVGVSDELEASFLKQSVELGRINVA